MIDGNDVLEFVLDDRDLFGIFWCVCVHCAYLMTHRIGNAIVSVNAFTSESE